jgi:threonine/homoserine/homoserine lactone efflux protein
VGAHLLVFLGVSAIVIVVPGPDTAVVTKNVLLHGRRCAFGTSFGVCSGLAVWTIAAAIGVVSILRASSVAFTALKIVGAMYLVWLGLAALRESRRGVGREPGVDFATSSGTAGWLTGFRQGFLSDLGNPKIGVFFTSLLPQFLDSSHAMLGQSLALGAIFVVITLAWLSVYCLLAARAAQTLTRPRVRAALDGVTGVVLIALGLRLAIERG